MMMFVLQRNSFTTVCCRTSANAVRHISSCITTTTTTTTVMNQGRQPTDTSSCRTEQSSSTMTSLFNRRNATSSGQRCMSTASFYRPTMSLKMMSSSSESSSLPYHLVVGLPALSPTMEVGTLSEWYKAVGDTFHAGDAIARIETDKAAIDFEAQDDGVVAKILISANDGADIPVGTPIMITVEDAADVAAFYDYVVVPAAVTAPVVAVVATPNPSPPPVPITATAPSPPPQPVIAAPIPVPTAASSPMVTPVTTSSSSTTNDSDKFSTAIPGMTYINTKKSPLTYTLNQEQMKYMELYGTTGQHPIS